MPINPHTRQDIVNELVAGHSVRNIAEKYGKSLGLVQSIRREVLEGAVGNASEEIGVIEPEVLVGVANSLSMTGNTKASAEVKKLSRGVDALQRFQPKLIQTAENILGAINEKLTTGVKVTELSSMVRMVNDLNDSFFNTNVVNNLTQVNVGGISKQDEFKEIMQSLEE